VARELESPPTLAELAVDGRDLMEVGFQESPELGRVLRTLLAEVVDDPALNDRDALLERARAELP
jgi:tRNA nucleotidyltransferase (CCA-adding enzyme)